MCYQCCACVWRHSRVMMSRRLMTFRDVSWRKHTREVIHCQSTKYTCSPANHRWARFWTRGWGESTVVEAVTYTMATVQDTCSGCSLSYFRCISKYFEQSSAANEFLRDHGVLPKSAQCPNCNSPCKLREDRHQWYCGRYRALGKKKRKQCHFTVSWVRVE